MTDFQCLIKEICDENNIKMDIISRDWIMALEKNGIRHFIVGCRFDSNDHGIGQILDDKFATYEALNLTGNPIIYHEIQYSTKNHTKHAKGNNTLEHAYDFFYRHNQNIVIKVNNGSKGKGCYHITSKKQIRPTLDKLFQRHYSLSLCPYCEIKNEYRVVMLNGKPELVYQKQRPIVIGDGTSTIRELLINLNPHYFTGKIYSKKYKQVLKKGEIFSYNWQFNLSKGAIINEDINQELKNKLIKIASKAVNDLQANFVSVDIIDTPDGLFILEINSGVSTGHYRKLSPDGRISAKKIYTKAILKMFE